MAKTILNFHFDYWNPSLNLAGVLELEKKSQERVRDYLVREFAGTKLDSREQKAEPSVEDNRRTCGHLDGWHETSNI